MASRLYSPSISVQNKTFERFQLSASQLLKELYLKVHLSLWPWTLKPLYCYVQKILLNHFQIFEVQIWFPGAGMCQIYC